VQGRQEVARLKQRLDETFKRVDKIPLEQIELRSDFAKYLCVLVSGYVESAAVEMLDSFTAQSASPRVQRYVAMQLEWFMNPKRERLLQLLGSFDTAWRSSLEQVIVDDREAALSSVVTLRNKIAHGESVSLSYVQISAYYEQVQEVVTALVDLIDPP
jgi:hypothetical protein